MSRSSATRPSRRTQTWVIVTRTNTEERAIEWVNLSAMARGISRTSHVYDYLPAPVQEHWIRVTGAE
eukprot:12285831-Prorocentrum_lima.AAC.1